MKRILGIFVFIVIQYILVAGIAWRWVLGMEYSFLRLIGIAALQGAMVIIQIIAFPGNKSGKNKEGV